MQKNELVRYISSRSGLNEGAIDHVIKELRDAIAFFNLAARPVNIEGLGMYFPTIDTQAFPAWDTAWINGSKANSTTRMLSQGN